MKRHSLIRNLTANTAGYLVMLALAFVMFPVMFHRLGAARYGIWALISQVTGYYTYVGLGIRAGVSYYTGLYVAQGKPREVNQIVSTSVWSLAAVGLALAPCGFALAALFPRIFSTGGLDPHETFPAVVLSAFAVAAGLPGEAMNSALAGAKRLDVVNMIDMSGRIATSAALLIAVLRGHGLVALSLIQLASRILMLPVIYTATRLTLPEISISLRYWDTARLKQFVRFGVPSVLIGVGWLIGSRTDLVVIGAMVSASAVSYYAIPRSLMDYADSGVRALALSFVPQLTHLHARDQNESVARLYLRAARIIGLVVCVGTALIAVFGKAFLAIWQGSAFATGPWRNRPSVVLLILTVAFIPRLMNSMAVQLGYATNRLNFFVWIAMAQGVVKIVLSVLLVRPLGLAGVAISNLLPLLLFEGLAILIYLFKKFPFTVAEYAREVMVKPVAAGVCALVAAAVLARLWTPVGWPALLAEMAAAGCVGLAVAVGIGTTAEERASFRSFLSLRGRALES